MLRSLIILSIFLVLSCTSKNNEAKFTLSNTGNLERTEQPITISRSVIEEKFGIIPESKVPVPFKNKTSLPSQTDDLDGDGKWDELAFLVNFDSAETSQKITVRLAERSSIPTFTKRTNIRFGILENNKVKSVDSLTISGKELPVPLFTRYQMDGPAWENDRIGFRQYIDGRNGRDLFGKLLPTMALDTVGISKNGALEDNYHTMLPWGRDILAVGNSLGLGGLAVLENGTPVRLGVKMDASENNVADTRFNIITEGAVRSIFQIIYNDWDTGDSKYKLTHTATIWAGKYGYSNKIELESEHQSDTLLVGMVNIHNDKKAVVIPGDIQTIFYTHDKQTYDKEWFLGMGLILPSKNYNGYTETPDSGPGITTSFLNNIILTNSKSFEYHIFAGWELSDERFSDQGFFEQMLLKEAELLEHPVIVIQ